MQNKTLQMKRALHTALLVLLLSVVGVTKMYAYDFYAVCETGQTLYYNITDATNHYVKLTYPGVSPSNPWYNYTEPTGNIIFPESVQYNGITYSVTSIGDYALNNCSGLTGNLTIPNSVTTLGEGAFWGCSGFTGSLIIGNSVTTIGTYAFRSCSGFNGSLIIGNSVTTIGPYAFTYCPGFTGSLTIPSSVTYIGSYAFNNCRGLTLITIPSSVVYIETNPFSHCASLEQIIVNSGNPVYDSRNSCNAIVETGTSTLIVGCKNTIIPNSVNAIDDSAFNGCVGLTTIEIPDSVTTIATNSFSDCFNLEQIIVSSGNPVFDSRNNCNAIVETNTNTLSVGCKNTVIPNSITKIAAYAFYGCSSLTMIVIPNSVTMIGGTSFFGCSGLTSLTIGNSVAMIGNYAFVSCSNLCSIKCLAETPPLLSNYVFSNVPKTIPVYVPIGTLEAYQNADGWNEFTNYYEIENLYIINASTDPEAGGTIIGAGYYNPGEEVTLTAIPNLNYVFDGWIENDTVVSNDEIYSFVATRNRDLVAKLTYNSGINEQDGIIVSTFPNPANGAITIEAEDIRHITISNLLGQTIFDGNAGGDVFEYDFSKHKAGIYLIRVETSSGVAVKKVSVTR